jgi:5-formyltetrahydrofolate cyclo-ligase
LWKFLRAPISLFGFHSNVNKETTPKSTLRSEMRTHLNQIPQSSIDVASEKICQQIALADGLLHEVQTIAVFAAHGPEISLEHLHELLPEKTWVYPLCQPQSRLTFHHIPSPSELIPGMLGIREPDTCKHAEVNLPSIDLILCPGLAFGNDGTRLGQGGGFYDRLLHRFHGMACGIAMTTQIIDTIPHEAHDIHMDYLITENGIQPTKLG